MPYKFPEPGYQFLYTSNSRKSIDFRLYPSPKKFHWIILGRIRRQIKQVNIFMSRQVLFHFFRLVYAGIIQNDYDLVFWGTLSQLRQEPLKSITVRLPGFFPVKSLCHKIQATKECETFPLAGCRNLVAATFF